MYLNPCRFIVINTCVPEFVLYPWSDQSEFMAVFMIFHLLIGPGFIFEPCSYFQ